MHKISSLVAHLLAVSGLPREQVTAYADKGALIPTGRHLGLTGEAADLEQVEIGVWKYDAVIQLERYAGDGPTLLALVLGWLSDNDPDRDGLADPEVDAELSHGGTFDVEIACEFEERLTVVEDPAGPVAFNGKSWRVAMPEVAEAEAVSGLEGHRG